MTIDLMDQIGAVRREVRTGTRDGQDTKILVATRTYDAELTDVWDALTSTERIPRWFLPITGELRRGGRYQLEGNASGDILECEPPHRLAVTWEFGGGVSWVAVRLVAADPERTTLELEHTAVVPDEFWPVYGPGAAGVGWDLSLLELARHLCGAVEALDPAWPTTDEGRVFMGGSSEAWGDASVAAGEDPAAARAAAGRTTEFYTTPEPEPDGAHGDPGEATG